MFLGLEAIDEEGLRKYRKRVSLGRNFEALEFARSLGINVAINLIADPDWDHERFRIVREWCLEHARRHQYQRQHALSGDRELDDRRAAGWQTRDYRLFDIQHAVLPTRLPLAEFYDELVTTQRAIYRRHLDWRQLWDASGIVARLLLRGQTNFRQEPVQPQQRLSAGVAARRPCRTGGLRDPFAATGRRRASARRPRRSTSMPPRGRKGRAIDAATERFVEETRMGTAP